MVSKRGMRGGENRITTLKHDPKHPVSIDVFLSQNESRRRGYKGQPMMVFQVYDASVSEDDIATIHIHADQAKELRNHLDAFLRHCAKQEASDD